jgi:hypothetical protein
MILVIRARACRADVPFTPDGRVDVVTTGALLNVTVNVSVLSEVDDEDVVEPEDVAKLEALVNVVLDKIVEVVLRRFDQGPPNKAELLPVTGDEELKLEVFGTVELSGLDDSKELVLLELKFVNTADDGVMSVILLLNEVFSAKVEVPTGGVIKAGPLVELDDDADVVALLLLELEEELNPGIIRERVVDELAVGEVLLSKLVDKLDVAFTPNDSNIDNVLTTELEFVGDRVELVIGKSGVALGEIELVESVVDKLVKFLEEDPLEITGTKFVELRTIDTLDEGAGAMGIENVPVAMLDDADDGFEMTTGDEGTSLELIVLDVAEGAESGSVLPAEIEGPAMTEDDKLLEGAAGGIVAVIVVVRSELDLTVVVVSTLRPLLVAGSGSDTVKAPLDAVVAEFDGMEGLSLQAIDGSDATGNDVAPPTMVVMVLVDVVI